MSSVLQFPEYAPDIIPYGEPESSNIVNAVPRKDGYGPVADLSAFSAALPAQCRGFFSARAADGSALLFAATSTRLWKLNNTDLTWVPVSKVSALTSIDADNGDSFTKSLLHFNGTDASTTITDSNTGGSAHTWTARGNAQIDTAISQFGGAALLLDGTGDWVDTPDSTDFTLGSSDFTIECWFNPAAFGAAKNIAGQIDAAGTANANSAWRISQEATNVIAGRVVQTTTQTTVTGTTAITVAGWHHVAFLRTGNILRLFVDGVQEGGDVAFTGAVNDSTSLLGVGSGGDFSASALWTGSIDEFRFANGVARYSSTFTPSVPALFTLSSHGLSIGDAVVFSTSSSLPGGLTVGTVYYVIATNFTSSTFKVATSVGGTAVQITSAGAGTQSFTGQYVAPPTADQWNFVQFNNLVFATQINAVLQVIDITAPAAFTDALGSPPQARYIAVVNRFLVLSGLSSSTPYRVQWSGLNSVNASTSWTSGIASSDFQDLPDGGIVRSIGGGEYGLICQDGAIRRMTYAPGSSYVFEIQRIVQDQGLLGPLSLIRAGDRLFYYGTDGFKMLIPGAYPQPIGKERVDRTFIADLDTGNFQLFQGSSEPNTTRVYWAYKSNASGTTTAFGKILIYDYVLDKWTVVTGISGEYISTSIRPGYTLDALDSTSGSIDALAIGSLDDLVTVPNPKLVIFDTSHRLAFQGAQNLEATLETSEQEVATQSRIRVQGVRPITDAPVCYISISKREHVQTVPVYSAETAVNSTGVCPANVSTRLARAKLRIPAQTVWTVASGIEPISHAEGRY